MILSLLNSNTGARDGLVGRAQRLHQTAVYKWVSAGGDLALQRRAPHWAKYIGLACSYPGSVVYLRIFFQKVHRFPPPLNLNRRRNVAIRPAIYLLHLFI